MKLKNLVASAILAALALLGPLTARAEAPRQYVIERDIPGVSKMTADQLRDASRLSNKVLNELGTDIQWVHSYVAGDKIYCVYNASSEAVIREHAKRSGFPATKITAVAAVIDPTTAR